MQVADCRSVDRQPCRLQRAGCKLQVVFNPAHSAVREELQELTYGPRETLRYTLRPSPSFSPLRSSAFADDFARRKSRNLLGDQVAGCAHYASHIVKAACHMSACACPCTLWRYEIQIVWPSEFAGCLHCGGDIVEIVDFFATSRASLQVAN